MTNVGIDTTEGQERLTTPGDAPLGLESEFPQYVWVPILRCDGKGCNYTQENETFVVCYRTREDAEVAMSARPVQNRRRRWFWEPTNLPFDLVEWVFEEFESFCREKGAKRSIDGAIIRGLALFDRHDHYVMKRYFR